MATIPQQFQMAEVPMDYTTATEYLDQTLETTGPETPDEAITHALDNFASKEAMFSVSHRLIPPFAFFGAWEPRLQAWVGIPQGMNRPLLPENYFHFFTNFLWGSIKLSASRKGIGRQQTMNVLMAYFAGAPNQQGFMQPQSEDKKERWHGTRQAIRKLRGKGQNQTTAGLPDQ